MGSGRHSSSGPGGHGSGTSGGATGRRARAALVPLLLAAAPAWAQGDAAPDVVINHDVLNNLALPVPVVPGLDRTAPEAATLRPAPSQPPRSRLLVQPVRQAARKPAAPPPAGPSEPARQPAAAAAEIDRTPDAVAAEPAPVGPDPVGGATAAAPAPPPAVPPPPEPADSATSGTMANVPPPPPPPPLEPPAGGAIPPAPEPAAIADPPRPADGRDQTASQSDGQQLAARPAAAPGAAPVRLRFEAGSAELTEQARAKLVALTDLLLADQAQRVQLRAYAQGVEQQANAARRLSLSRARAVRAFLAERGVPTSRIDVRALGAKFQDGPPDRVDIVYAKR